MLKDGPQFGKEFHEHPWRTAYYALGSAVILLGGVGVMIAWVTSMTYRVIEIVPAAVAILLSVLVVIGWWGVKGLRHPTILTTLCGLCICLLAQVVTNYTNAAVFTLIDGMKEAGHSQHYIAARNYALFQMTAWMLSLVVACSDVSLRLRPDRVP
jgi:hypothetical protein